MANILTYLFIMVLGIVVWNAIDGNNLIWVPLIENVNQFNLNGSSVTGAVVVDTAASTYNAVSEKVSEVVLSKPISISDVENAILKYTNEVRKNNGLSELKQDDNLGRIAREHSDDMVKNDYFDHVNLNGEDPSDRAKRTGFTKRKQSGGGWYSEGIAENIGKMPTGNVVGVGYVLNNADSIAKAHVNSWMESPGHRANILNKQYTNLGVGVSYDGLYYVATQNFW